MNAKRSFIHLLATALLWMAMGCQAGASTAVGSATPSLVMGQFTPFRSAVPSQSITPFSHTPSTPTPLPTITPTPRTHVVKAGEDMSGIALRYRVALDELKSANPTVNPRLMLVGTVLLIPGTAPAAVGTGVTPATVTPQPVLLGVPRCTPDVEGGLLCFVEAQNHSQTDVLNLSVMLRVMDASGRSIAEQTVFLPLDLLPAETNLPLMARFAAPLPPGFQISAAVVSAIPASSAAERYTPAQVEGLETSVEAGGLTAKVTGVVRLTDPQAAASQWSLLAIAYARDGSVIGVRRWDSLEGLKGEQSAPFTLQVYSSSQNIEKVTVLIEARK